MKYINYFLLVFIYYLQTSFASPALKIQVGDISKEKCKEYSIKVKNCGHSVQKITQGIKIAELNEFPHMALIGYDDKEKGINWACEGSLISDQYVLTTAYCLTTKNNGNATYVKIGVNNVTDNSNKAQEFKIIERVIHPDYKSDSYYNNVGLVKLDKKIQFSENAYPACLNTNTGLDVERAILSGFDRYDDDETKGEVLKKTVFEIKSEKECSDVYNERNRKKLLLGIDHKSQFCGGVLSAVEGEFFNTIAGDPLQIYHNEQDGVQCMYDIIGYVSFGTGFYNKYPDVFTRISPYIGWIESVVWA